MSMLECECISFDSREFKKKSFVSCVQPRRVQPRRKSSGSFKASWKKQPRMDQNEAFCDLFKAYVKAYPEKKKSACQVEATEFWNKSKTIEPKDTFPGLVKSKIQQLEALALGRQGTLLKFWAKAASAPSSKSTNPQPSTSSPEHGPSDRDGDPSPSNQPEETEIAQPSTGCCLKRPAPAQEKISAELAEVTAQVLRMKERKSAGLMTEEEFKQLKNLDKKRSQLEKDLKTKISEQKRQAKRRALVKHGKEKLLEEFPEAGKFLSVQPNTGRPRLEEKQSGLLKAICDIAIYGSAAQEKRQFEAIKSCLTLDQLTQALRDQGFQLSRSATYLRLLPRRSNTSEGKRHVNPVPVRLQKATNSKHNDHQDGRFCCSTIRFLEELSSLLGPDAVAFLSQDDKARVVIGLPAANKQAPLLMHVEYRVVLPDHDWIVAQRHKLIPSVTAGIAIKQNGMGKPEAVGYSGPTYIGIRSGKHSSSTAYSHALDFKRLTELEEFAPIMRHGGLVKPVVVIVVDGGPDENPRYRKVIQVAIHHFLEHNLDAIFIATNAPGRSAYNRVERRMAPLSHDLAGLILPHDHYGSHLDSQLRTVDDKLERKNFKYAGEALAEVWSGKVIDEYPTVAEYIDPEASEIDPDTLEVRDQSWLSNHVRTSQYLLQIVKCDDRACCTPKRSSLSTVLPNRFLPPPIPLIQSSDGLKAAEKGVHQHFPSLFVTNTLDPAKILPQAYLGFKKIPYDLFCPSQTNQLNDRICANCGLYFASQVMLKEHKKEHKTKVVMKKFRPKRVVSKRQNELLVATMDGDLEWFEDDKVDLTDVPIDYSGTAESLDDSYPIVDIEKHLSNPWAED